MCQVTGRVERTRRLGLRLILGDSIVHDLVDNHLIKVRSFPGVGVQRLRKKLLVQRIIDLGEFGIVVLHVGTNDIYLYEPDVWVRLMAGLVQDLRAVYPGVSFIFSAILPRPRDLFVSDPLVKAFNQQLQRWADQHGVPFARTNRPFFAKRFGVKGAVFRDGLHLKTSGPPEVNGLALLECYFQQLLGDDSRLQKFLLKSEREGAFAPVALS